MSFEVLETDRPHAERGNETFRSYAHEARALYVRVEKKARKKKSA